MVTTTKIVIIGGKGTPVNIAEQIFDAQVRFNMNVEVLGFAFDDESFGSEINGFPIVSKTDEAKEKFSKFDDVKFIFNLYRPDKIRERAELLQSFDIPADKFYTFIHPSAYVAKSAKIGIGCAIQAHCVVNSNVTIGDHNTFNSACLIGHDTHIGHYNFFAAHSVVGSGVTIKDYVFTGLNASLRNLITVGSDAIIGMGSNVLHDVQDGQIVTGNPAKPMNRKSA